MDGLVRIGAEVDEAEGGDLVGERHAEARVHRAPEGRARRRVGVDSERSRSLVKFLVLSHLEGLSFLLKFG